MLRAGCHRKYRILSTRSKSATLFAPSRNSPVSSEDMLALYQLMRNLRSSVRNTYI